MLDIVMVAHEANYRRMAHRSVSPKGEPTILGSLPSLVDRTPMTGKVVLALDAGNRQGFEAAEAYLSTQNLQWQISHDDEGVGSYYDAVMRGLELCASPLVAIVPAWVEVVDPLWVQRITWPLTKDQTAIACTTWLEQGPAKDLAPQVAFPRKWPGGEFIVGRRAELHDLLRLLKPDDFYNDLALAIARNGWRLWSHAGIRFSRHPHEPHEARKKIGK